MDTRWASVVGDDVDGDFLVLELHPLLRGSVEICNLGGTPSHRVQGLEVGVSQKHFVGLEPKLGVLYPKVLRTKP